MEKHTCRTYFAIYFKFNEEKNLALLKERKECLPQDIDIFNKDQVERYIIDNFDVKPEWRRHHFVVGLNEEYDVDVNAMLRVTLKKLMGKESVIKGLCKLFDVSTSLVIVPRIASGSDMPNQMLSLDFDIISFLYESGTSMDLDYYVI